MAVLAASGARRHDRSPTSRPQMVRIREEIAPRRDARTIGSASRTSVSSTNSKPAGGSTPPWPTMTRRRADAVTRIVLVRHGETVWHAENRYAGRSDVELTPRGREQADAPGRVGGGRRAGRDLVLVAEPRARDGAAAASRQRTCRRASTRRLCELRLRPRRGADHGRDARSVPAAARSLPRRPRGRPPPRRRRPSGRRRPRRRLPARHRARAPAAAASSWSRTPPSSGSRCAALIGLPLIANYRRLFPFVRNVAITEIRRDGDETSLLQYNAPLDPALACRRIARRPPERQIAPAGRP